LIITYRYDELGIVYEIPDIYRYVLYTLREIPKGKITTYGELGAAIGDKIAARAIGYIMATNPRPDIYPCYKVVNRDGSIGKYSLGKEEKIRRLRKEGIRIESERIIDFQDRLVRSHQIDVFPYLRSLRNMQSWLSVATELSDEHTQIRNIASFDLSYVDGPPDISICVGCLFDIKNTKLNGLAISILPVFIPYIPTYLAFRELPAILLCLEHLMRHRKPDAVFLDGQGVLHPRRFGIATHIGVIANLTSVGIAKTLLCGRVVEKWSKSGDSYYAPIELDGEILGFIIRKNRHEIIVSPGHRISPEKALEIALNLEWRPRDPEPLVMRVPHLIATSVRKKIKAIYNKIRAGLADITEFMD